MFFTSTHVVIMILEALQEDLQSHDYACSHVWQWWKQVIMYRACCAVLPLVVMYTV